MDEDTEFDELAAGLLKALAQNPHETATQSPGQLVAKAYALAAEFAGRLAPQQPAPPPKKPSPAALKS